MDNLQTNEKLIKQKSPNYCFVSLLTTNFAEIAFMISLLQTQFLLSDILCNMLSIKDPKKIGLDISLRTLTRVLRRIRNR